MRLVKKQCNILKTVFNSVRLVCLLFLGNDPLARINCGCIIEWTDDTFIELECL